MAEGAPLTVEISGLVKNFGDTRAIDGVDLAVRPGTVCCILGPNGAGKTTTIRILATLLRPDDGTARVLGHDVVREAAVVRRRMSLTGQSTAVDEELTGLENLVLVGRLLGHRAAAARARADDLLAAFGLTDLADRLVRTYSGGEQRRLDLAASMVVPPDLLVLDEPTTGLDPHSRNQVWESIRSMVDEGMTVLLTTQYLEEADRLADHIVVIDHGKVIAEGTPGELKSRTGSSALRVRLIDPAQRDSAERALADALDAPVQREADPALLSARIFNAERAARALAELSGSGVAIAEFALSRPSLDEVFLTLTGHRTEAEPAGEPVANAVGKEDAA